VQRKGFEPRRDGKRKSLIKIVFFLQLNYHGNVNMKPLEGFLQKIQSPNEKTGKITLDIILYLLQANKSIYS
jgi:hypothetical protein